MELTQHCRLAIVTICTVLFGNCDSHNQELQQRIDRQVKSLEQIIDQDKAPGSNVNMRLLNKVKATTPESLKYPEIAEALFGIKGDSILLTVYWLEAKPSVTSLEMRAASNPVELERTTWQTLKVEQSQIDWHSSVDAILFDATWTWDMGQQPMDVIRGAESPIVEVRVRRDLQTYSAAVKAIQIR